MEREEIINILESEDYEEVQELFRKARETRAGVSGDKI